MNELNHGVRVKNLFVGYRGKAVIQNLSFEVKSPFMLIIMGPNGAGKTTLLRTLIGSLKPFSGQVEIYGLKPWLNKKAVRSIVGYVPQLMHIHEEVPVTVEEIVAMGLLSRLPPPRVISGRIKEAITNILRLVGMEEYRRTFFNHLSGGQQKKVLIASALIRRPKLLIMDEPGSSLDFKSRCELMQFIERIHTIRATDIIVTSHELPSCLNREPNLLLINRGIYRFGRVRDVLRRDILSKIYPGLTELEGIMILGEDHARC